MLGYILCFVAGLFIGGFLGVLCLALCIAGRQDDDGARELLHKEAEL